MSLSHEQQHALDLFIKGENLFITGPGGVGKTHLIHKFKENAKIRGKKMQVCALTGCASLLLGQCAKTIHSWSGIGIARGTKKQIIDKTIYKRRIKSNWRGTQILVIDEVSMMSKKIFEILEELGRILKMNPSHFGGLQIIMLGDFFQLPPIGNVKEPDTSAFCFESSLWKDIFPLQNHIILNTMFRQKDPKYIEILSQIRQKSLNNENIDLLYKHCEKKYEQNENNDISITKIYPIRAKVDYINATMFDKLESESVKYEVDKLYDCKVYLDTGKMIEEDVLKDCNKLSKKQVEYESDNVLNNSQCEIELQLKIGAIVMCTANIDLTNGICNGSQGIIIDLIGPNKKPKILFVNGITMVMSKYHWQSYDCPTIAIKQYPLRLAWALTIHKIQGATLDMAEIDAGSSIFEYGQTYVAMSRVKTLDGLYLSDFNPNVIKVNKKVVNFYKTIEQADAAAAMRRDDAVQNSLPLYDRDVTDAHAAAVQRREEARTKLEELNSKVVAIRAQLDGADPDPVAGLAAGPPATSTEVECPICLDHPKRIVFQCGHQACAACAASIQVCHSCRAPITHRITPF